MNNFTFSEYLSLRAIQLYLEDNQHQVYQYHKQLNHQASFHHIAVNASLLIIKRFGELYLNPLKIEKNPENFHRICTSLITLYNDLCSSVSLEESNIIKDAVDKKFDDLFEGMAPSDITTICFESPAYRDEAFEPLDHTITSQFN